MKSFITIKSKKNTTLLNFMFCLLSLVSCTPHNSIASKSNAQVNIPSTKEKTIVLGDISNNPQKKIRKFQPLANYLVNHLDDFEQGKVKVAPDMETMIAWLKNGEVDIYIDSPYPAMLAMKNADAKPILRRWKKGSAEYHSIIFAMKDYQISKMADLKGKTIAFDHPASTTGYMLPLAELSKLGVKLVEKKSRESPVPKDTIGYIFSYEDENNIEWVLSGKVDAAAINSLDFSKISPEIRNKLVILAETDSIARNLVMVNKDMPPKQQDSITKTLLVMNESVEGQEVLKKFSGTTKFDYFFSTESLDRIHELYLQVQNDEVE